MGSQTREKIVNHPIGGILYRIIRPIVLFARKKAHPGVDPLHQLTRVTCNGKQFDLVSRRGSSDDPQAIQQCFVDSQYDFPQGEQRAALTGLYREILASGRKPLIIDCGANIGASVVWFSMTYPEAHIIAVEPASSNCEVLRQNIRGLDVDLRQAAVDATDHAKVLIDRGSQLGFFIADQGEGETVQTVSINTLVASKPSSQFVPFLLKLDIEGGEKSLFSGDVSAISQFPIIIMEPHDSQFVGQNISREFFRFHVESSREFAQHHENVASIVIRPLEK